MFRKIVAFMLIAAVFVSIPAAYAQTPQTVIDAEAERDKQLTKELSLNLPDITDDPNYPVTFTDPSGKGVDITVDGKTSTSAPNPFILSNLSIGNHSIVFKFTNKDGLLRVLSKNLLVAPKSPVFDATVKTTVIRPSQVVLTGKALPQSTVEIIVNSLQTYKFSANQDGKFEFIIPDVTEGKINIIGFVIRDGYVSDPSKTLTIEYKASGEIQILPPQGSTGFDIRQQISKLDSQIKTFAESNPREFYGILIATGLIIAAIIFLSLRRRMTKKREEKSIADLFKGLSSQKTILDIVNPQSKSEPEKPKAETAKGKDKKEKKKDEKVKPDEKVVVAPIAESAKKQKKEAGRIAVITDSAKSQAITPIESTPAETPKNKDKKTKKPPKESPKTEVKEVTPEVEVEEPKKTVLSKEEFLKQFNEKKDK